MFNWLGHNTTASSPKHRHHAGLSLSLTIANRLGEQSLLKMKPVANLQWTKAAPGCLTNLSVMSTGWRRYSELTMLMLMKYVGA